MRKFPVVLAIALPAFASAFPSAFAQQPNVTDTRLLSQPALSATHIAFMYSGDLWSAKLDGSDVRRLTTADGDEQSPVFSPDGKLVAFSANYDGNTDVFVVPVTGGEPRRLTWHPGADIVQGFTPDGKSIGFTSGRESYTGNLTQLYTVPVTGGPETRLPLPSASRASWSPDGKHIAYNPLSPRFEEWKHYRGGTASTVWIYDVASHGVDKIPQPAGRCNDVDAQWIGNTVYFRSDRDGEFNVYAYDVASKKVRALTSHTDFPVLGLSVDGASGKIAYEQAGYLRLMDASGGTSRHLAIGVAADLRETRPRFVKSPAYVRNIAVSPTGMRAAFEYRGEIVTVPASKGDYRNLTNTVGANERSPAWSPDGASIAYVSDASGEYQLVIEPQDGHGTPRVIKLMGHGFYANLAWSPDSKKISYDDNSESVYVLDVATGTSKLVAGNKVYAVGGLGIDKAWSPDSKWLAYVVGTQSLVNALFVYDVAADKSQRITDGLSEVAEPAFDRSGRYLYVFASTDAGPLQDWFSLASSDAQRTRNIYAVVLRKDLANPLAKESDEERIVVVRDSAARGDSAGGGVRLAPAAPPAGGGATRIDFDGIESRILSLPIPASDLSNLQTGDAGQLYYIRSADNQRALHHYNLTTRTDETLSAGVGGYSITADGKKLLYSRGGNYYISPINRIVANEGLLGVADIEVKIDPRAEWTQIFNEAWRINRDYFYAPNMHGVDWEANRKKYAVFLADATTKADVNRVIQWMMSELSVGHHRGGGGDRLTAPRAVPGGLLGADYAVENGRYRIAKIYGGLNWTPGLRSPLTEPGVNARAGDYLIAVNGVDLKPPTNVYAAFENTSGKITSITLASSADGAGSRTVQVVPIPNEAALRNRAWVEGNLRKVDSATNGRVAYVYVPNTGGAGYQYFRRYFYPQAYKDGIIVDERFNGGGSYADYYIDILRRPLISYWAMRYGDDMKTPTASIQGPKAMLIDETAGSGGDMLPWMFHNLKMGPLIGKRTWGGLVGILGFPTLMDGGTITAPNFAIWTPEEGWAVENIGVPPDIEVDQLPAAVIAGHDPQLEKAIEVVMAELRKNPPKTPARPAYPNKVQKK
ncbi:MAG TPA: PDZ domain-containing protein [Gemmatimonadaceae bacterium]|nr:PDZ domain-containing protein [Gemmatimonadaceae bacterium]